jgi:phosphoglucosamine mutase
MTAEDGLPRPTEGGIGLVGDARGLVRAYEDFLLSKAPKLSGMRVVLDCANGATYRVAPAVFAHAGAEVVALADTPDGLNINERCGSTYPELVQRMVVERGADVGFAFDGDGDRLVIADHRGQVHDGDFVLALAARHFARGGRLRPRLVVGTVMTNGGLEATLKRDGIELIRTAVGDRYVWEKMEELDAQFGGEPSGHVIFREHATTGDGILTALEVLHLARAEDKPIAELAAEIESWPQAQRAVRVARRGEWQTVAAFRDEYERAKLDVERGGGRVFVRPSGTEPVLRILVESRVGTVAAATAERLARVAEEALK